MPADIQRLVRTVVNIDDNFVARHRGVGVDAAVHVFAQLMADDVIDGEAPGAGFGKHLYSKKIRTRSDAGVARHRLGKKSNDKDENGLPLDATPLFDRFVNSLYKLHKPS